MPQNQRPFNKRKRKNNNPLKPYKKFKVLVEVAMKVFMREATNPPLGSTELAWNFLAVNHIVAKPIKRNLQKKYFEAHNLFFSEQGEADRVSFHVFKQMTQPNEQQKTMHMLSVVFRSYANQSKNLDYEKVTDMYAEIIMPSWNPSFSLKSVIENQQILSIRYFFLNGMPFRRNTKEKDKIFDFARKTVAFHGRYILFASSLENILDFWLKTAIMEADAMHRKSSPGDPV